MVVAMIAVRMMQSLPRSCPPRRLLLSAVRTARVIKTAAALRDGDQHRRGLEPDRALDL
jgi:hypothetical protein